MTTITSLSSGMYQIDDNSIPVDATAVTALMQLAIRNTWHHGGDDSHVPIIKEADMNELTKYQQALEREGSIRLNVTADKGVVVDMYEVDYPTPTPGKDTEELSSHLNERRDFVTQYLFPGTETNDVVVGLRSDILPSKKETSPMATASKALSMLSRIATALKAEYKTENKVTLPNSAGFSGDKWPKDGDPVKHEQEAWHAGNKEEQRNIAQENRAKLNSPLATGDANQQDVASQMKQPHGVAKHVASSAVAMLNAIADLTFTKEPDGTVEIEMTDTPAAIPPAPVTPAAPAPDAGATPIPADEGKKAASSLHTVTAIHKVIGLRGIVRNSAAFDPSYSGATVVVAVLGSDKEEVWKVADVTFTNTHAWVIDKRAGRVLIGTECEKNAGIEVADDSGVLRKLSVRKQGRPWRELIPQGVWQSDLDV